MLYGACFGDSLIEGYPFGPRAGWCAAAEEATAQAGARALRLLNYGLCGDCVGDILARLRQYRPVLPPYVGHIIFLGGANDCLQGLSQAATVAGIQAVAAYCAAQGLELAVVLPLLSGEASLNRSLSPLREAIAQALPETVYVLDLQPALGWELPALGAAYVDGVHPSCAAYQALGRYAAPRLQQWLEQGRG